MARAIERRGFPVARPVAVGERRRLGVLERSWAVTRDLGARDLRVLLEAARENGAERRALLERFARFARRLHDAGVDQDDFSPNNFLVRGDGEFVLIDFERARLRRGPLGARAWTQLAKLHRRDFGVSRSERLRFLRTYLGSSGAAGRAERRAAWEKIWPEFRRIRARDARRAAEAAFKEGRHLAREGEAWLVRARAGEKTIRARARRGRRTQVLGARAPARAARPAGAAPGASRRRRRRAARSRQREAALARRSGDRPRAARARAVRPLHLTAAVALHVARRRCWRIRRRSRRTSDGTLQRNKYPLALQVLQIVSLVGL